ncbi:MAG TPA: asparagine synthase C-terminal domain-containing protein [Nitrospiraceae bacterium]|nr:asparagine synthase C-terminal domain-containing protein [Nitrospiraceae bacterium]
MQDSTSTTISGDPTCAEPRYFTIIDGQYFVSSDILSVLRARRRSGYDVEVCPVAISHLLHDGFVSQPCTVYKDVFAVSMGMSAKLENGRLAFGLDFPFLKSKSLQDQVADPAGLLRVLAKATSRACNERAKPMLMLSAGLDSTSLALAVKEAGRDDTLCVTYTEHDDLDEAALAHRLCMRLGLRHETFHLDLESDAVCRLLQRYAAVTPEPCADPALTGCVAPFSRYADEDTVILDGSGNDAYFWKPPRRLDLAKLRWSLNRIPGFGRIRRALPMYLRYERLLSTPLELLLFAGPHLRHCDTRVFYPASVDTHSSWLRRFNSLDIPFEEVRSSIRSTFMGPAAHMMKTRNAAMFVGALARFPWTDHEVTKYCFNLPADRRFDLASGRNKVIMREMLSRFVDYDDKAIGKRVFKFDKRRFIERHLDFCRAEILGCALWEPAIERSLNGLVRAFIRGARTDHALLSLLMVSLWHNHWIVEGLPATLGPAQADSVAA